MFRRPSLGVARLRQEALGIPPDKRAIVSVGKGSLVKNHEFLVEALARMDNQSEIYCYGRF